MVKADKRIQNENTVFYTVLFVIHLVYRLPVSFIGDLISLFVVISEWKESSIPLLILLFWTNYAVIHY